MRCFLVGCFIGCRPTIPNWGTTQVHRKGAKPHSKGRWFHHVKHDTTKPLRSHRKLYHLRDWEIFQLKYECDIWLCKNCWFYVKNTSQRNILWQNCKVPIALFWIMPTPPKTSCNLSHAKTSIGQPAVACTPQDHGDLPKFTYDLRVG